MSEKSTRIKPQFNLKTAFLYTLVGGLVVSALISVAAVLIGEMNEMIIKALATTFILVSHSLVILAFLAYDHANRIGEDLLPTVIVGSIFANIITATLGIWEIWDPLISYRAFGLYTLLIGVAFILTGLDKLRIADKLNRRLTQITTILLGLWTLLLIPWIFVEYDMLSSLYYRLVVALTILVATSFVLLLIFRWMARSTKAELRAPVAPKPELSTPSLGLIFAIGLIVGFAWIVGISAFFISAAQVQSY
ncbi:hypothetical protein B7Y92_03400 [Candidatus Saccharibacteria bacterium 32-50-13]|nr:MAG: hypothetical protein B7Y92_03400 [Candidatus Saccharibacteria bacterium 32-50-13]